MKLVAGTGTVLAALAASACGGTTPPSLIQLRSQANQICSVANREGSRIPTPASEASGRAFLKRGIQVLSPELQQLRALSAPEAASVVYTTAIDAFSRELAAMRTAVRALDRGQDPVIAFKSLQQRLSPLETQADAAWQALGITACVND